MINARSRISAVAEPIMNIFLLRPWKGTQLVSRDQREPEKEPPSCLGARYGDAGAAAVVVAAAIAAAVVAAESEAAGTGLRRGTLVARGSSAAAAGGEDEA